MSPIRNQLCKGQQIHQENLQSVGNRKGPRVYASDFFERNMKLYGEALTTEELLCSRVTIHVFFEITSPNRI